MLYLSIALSYLATALRIAATVLVCLACIKYLRSK